MRLALVLIPVLVAARDSGIVGSAPVPADPCMVVNSPHLVFAAQSDALAAQSHDVTVDEWVWGSGPRHIAIEYATGVLLWKTSGQVLVYVRPDRAPGAYSVLWMVGGERAREYRQRFADLKTAGAVMSGSVTLDDINTRRPVPGAIVRVAGARHLAQTITTGGGRFEFLGLLPGAYTLTVEHEGARARAEDVYVPERGCVVRELTMERYGLAERAAEWMEMISMYYDVLHDVAMDYLRGR